jgi:hypothetical protein
MSNGRKCAKEKLAALDLKKQAVRRIYRECFKLRDLVTYEFLLTRKMKFRE